MRGCRYLVLGLLAGCSFTGAPGTAADAPGVEDPADANGLEIPDAPPGPPDGRPDADPPDAMPGTPDAPPPPPDAQQATCPGYAPVAGGFPAGATYRGFDSGASFNTASARCADDGGHIVVVDNATEAQAIAAIVEDDDQNNPSPFFWVGIYDPSGGGDSNWITTLGTSPPYLPWGENQPSGGFDDCVLERDTGGPWTFYDWGCGAPQAFVCECLP